MIQEKIQEIAFRVKELREIEGLTPEDICSLIKIPIVDYLDFEAGNRDIAAGDLLEIAKKLNVSLAVLLTGDAPKMNIYSVTRKDKGVEVDRRKQYKYESLAANFANKKAEPFVVTVDPNPPKKPDLNSHIGQEFNYIIEGRMRLTIHKSEIILGTGDSIYFDSSYPHAIEALDDKPARFLVIIVK